jgi:hypothetical protein
MRVVYHIDLLLELDIDGFLVHCNLDDLVNFITVEHSEVLDLGDRIQDDLKFEGVELSNTFYDSFALDPRDSGLYLSGIVG